MEHKEMQKILEEHGNKDVEVKSVETLEEVSGNRMYEVGIQDDQTLYVIIGSFGGCLITDSHDDAYEQWHIS